LSKSARGGFNTDKVTTADDTNNDDGGDDGEEEEEKDNDDDDEEEDDEDNEDDDDEDEQEGQSLLTSQAARNHVFPILISELVKESILDNKQGVFILKQFSQGNAVISAAIDVYDRDSDLAQLVHTLQQTAEMKN